MDSSQNSLAWRGRDLALRQAPGAGSVPVAGDVGRRGIDQRGTARLFAWRDRLAQPGSHLATLAGRL